MHTQKRLCVCIHLFCLKNVSGAEAPLWTYLSKTKILNPLVIYFQNGYPSFYFWKMSVIFWLLFDNGATELLVNISSNLKLPTYQQKSSVCNELQQNHKHLTLSLWWAWFSPWWLYRHRISSCLKSSLRTSIVTVQENMATGALLRLLDKEHSLLTSKSDTWELVRAWNGWKVTLMQMKYKLFY